MSLRYRNPQILRGFDVQIVKPTFLLLWHTIELSHQVVYAPKWLINNREIIPTWYDEENNNIYIYMYLVSFSLLLLNIIKSVMIFINNFNLLQYIVWVIIYLCIWFFFLGGGGGRIFMYQILVVESMQMKPPSHEIYVSSFTSITAKMDHQTPVPLSFSFGWWLNPLYVSSSLFLIAFFFFYFCIYLPIIFLNTRSAVTFY